MHYLNQFFGMDGKLKLDLEKKNVIFLDKLLENIADIAVC